MGRTRVEPVIVFSTRSHALRGNAVFDALRRVRWIIGTLPCSQYTTAMPGRRSDGASHATQSVEDGIPTQSVGTRKSYATQSVEDGIPTQSVGTRNGASYATQSVEDGIPTQSVGTSAPVEKVSPSR